VAGLVLVIGPSGCGKPPPTTDQRTQQESPTRHTDRDGDELPDGAVARLGTLRFRHRQRVCSVAFFPDGRRLAAGSWEDPVTVWDVVTGRRLYTLDAPGDLPTNVTVSPEGKVIAAGGGEGALHLWDTDSGKPVRKLGLNGSAQSLTFSPAGDRLYASVIERNPNGAAFVRAHLWSVPSGRELAAPTSLEHVTAAAFSPDGSYLVLASGEQFPLLWDIAAGEGRRLENCCLGGPALLAVMPGGRELVSLNTEGHGRSGSLSFWELATGKPVRRFQVGGGSMAQLAVTPDGRTLATLGVPDNPGVGPQVALWDAATGKRLATLPGLDDALSLAFSPSGKSLATGGARAVRLWEVPTGKEIDPTTGHHGPVQALAFSADGKSLVSSDAIDPPAVWDVASRKPRVSLPPEPGAIGKAIALTPNGERLTVARGNTCRLWDLRSGKPGEEFRGHWSAHAVAISGDGRFLAGGFVKTGGYAIRGELPRTLYLWGLRTGFPRPLELPGDPDDVYCLAFRADGKLLAAGGINSERWGVVRVLDTETGDRRFLVSPTGLVVQGLAFSPDGNLLAGGGGEESARPFDRDRGGADETFLAVWDAATGKEIRKLAGHRGAVYAVAFSPDGKTLASTGRDGVVCLWDVVSGRSVARLRGHRGRAYAVAFSPDGSTLASGGNDTTILLWDTKRLLERR
jgi:WD40 repeat protein